MRYLYPGALRPDPHLRRRRRQLRVAAAGSAAARRQSVPHAVSWYRAHPDEMQRDYAWCRDNPGIHDPNCAAAAEAKLQADFDAFVKAPR